LTPPDYTQAADALRDFYLRSHRFMDKLMAAHGASFSRTKMMRYIDLYGPVRSTDLASAFGFAPRTITEAVDGLERDGLVRRTADEHDRRVKRIALTEAGKEVLASTEPVRKQFGEKLFDVLEQQEIAQLANLLGKLNGRLSALEETLAEEDAPTREKPGARAEK